MSKESTVVTEEHFRYIRERTAGDDPFLAELKRAAQAEGLPTPWIAPEQASFLQIQVKLLGARSVVEVGTLVGVSAITLARALPPGGKVRTIEFVPAHADFARRWIAKSDVADRIEVITGAGLDVLPTFKADSADAAFIDADKKNYSGYLHECLRIVRKGGLIAVDNAFAFGQLFDKNPSDREAPAVKAFNEVMAAEKRLQSVIVPLGDGCWIGVKR